MLWLEHLPGILWMVLGVVVLHALGNFIEHCHQRFFVKVWCEIGEVCKARVELWQCTLEWFEFFLIDYQGSMFRLL